jgi:hypothetical protein
MLSIISFEFFIILLIIVFFIGIEFGRIDSSNDYNKRCPPQSTNTITTTIINDNINCKSIDYDSHSCPHSNIKPLIETTYLHVNDEITSVLTGPLSDFHHPSSAVGDHLVLTFNGEFKSDWSTCQSVYMNRAATRVDQPSKCLAFVRTTPYDNENSLYNYYNPQDITHRSGHIDWPQVLTDQYQEDWMKPYTYRKGLNATQFFLTNSNDIIKRFIDYVGSPFDINNNRRSIVIMVGNEGSMDLILNFVCSAKASGADLNQFVIISGQEDLVPLIEGMGVKGFHDASLGNVPREHSFTYADRAFALMMWMKVTSVYIALKAGFNVLFQDADLIWLKDPIPYLLNHTQYDVLFMDDGARTPRFSPLYTNTGFYFLRYTPKTVYLMERLVRAHGGGEILFTASHQATLIHYLTESHYLFGLRIKILEDTLFPQGRMYHEQKGFTERVRNHKEFPFVWHMCWTATREQKTDYLDKLGFWFLPTSQFLDGACTDTTKMLPWQLNNKQTPILGACCQIGGYYSGEINKKPLTPLLLPEIEHPMEYEKMKREKGIIK